MYAVATQLKVMAFIRNSRAIVGSATFTVESDMGVRKEDSVVTIKTVFLCVVPPASFVTSASSDSLAFYICIMEGLLKSFRGPLRC